MKMDPDPKTIIAKMVPPMVVHVVWVRSVPGGYVQVHWPLSMN